MTRIRSGLGYVASLYRTAERDARLNEEIDFHLDMAAERQKNSGVSESKAARVAAVRFGGRQQWREASRDEFRSRLLADIGQDLRYAVRAAKSAPAFTIASVLTLALGIGANTAIFSAVDGVMLKALPFSHEDRLVRLYESDRKKGIDREGVAPGNFNDWHARTSAFSAIATAEPFGFSLKGSEGTEEIRNWNVTRDFFAVLDAKPILGRLFQPADFVPGPPQAIVLTYASWQKRFGADPAVVGRRLTINGAQTTIVGVLPREFSFLETRMQQEFFAPKVLDSMEVSLRTSGWYNAVARLKPGVTISGASADLSRVAAQLAREHPRSNTDRGITVIPLRDGIISDSSRALGLSLAAVGLVLLIACGNVANLTLARMNRRSREFALRAALGASKWRVARQVLTESLLIATLGGATGVAFAHWGVSIIRAASPASMPRVEEIAVDGRTFVFALLTVIVTALLFGVAPALRAAELDAGDELKAGARSVGNKRQARIRGALVTGRCLASSLRARRHRRRSRDRSASTRVRSPSRGIRSRPGKRLRSTSHRPLLAPSTHFACPSFADAHSRTKMIRRVCRSCSSIKRWRECTGRGRIQSVDACGSGSTARRSRGRSSELCAIRSRARWSRHLSRRCICRTLKRQRVRSG